MEYLHSMHVVAKDNLSTIYRKMNKHLSSGHAVIYAAGLETSLTSDQIFSNMKQSGIIGRVGRYVESGALTILSNNREKNSAGTSQIDIQTTSDAWLMLDKIKKKSGFNRFLVISGESSLFSEGNSLGTLVQYEQRIAKMLAGKKGIQVVCCYPDSSIKKMPLAYLVPVVTAHQCSIHYHDDGSTEGNWLYKQWQPAVILETIHKEIEKSLGNGANYLIFRTFDLIYKIKEDMIVSQPELFEEKLRKILGKSVAQSLLESISREIRKQLCD